MPNETAPLHRDIMAVVKMARAVVDDYQRKANGGIVGIEEFVSARSSVDSVSSHALVMSHAHALACTVDRLRTVADEMLAEINSNNLNRELAHKACAIIADASRFSNLAKGETDAH